MQIPLDVDLERYYLMHTKNAAELLALVRSFVADGNAVLARDYARDLVRPALREAAIAGAIESLRPYLLEAAAKGVPVEEAFGYAMDRADAFVSKLKAAREAGRLAEAFAALDALRAS